MSQTTRCPACHTCFKVVADQLRISDGWVRCGECSQVFDATISLEPLEPPALLLDLHLDELRGPIERVKLGQASSVAWKAAPATASTTAASTAQAVDTWAWGKSETSQDVQVASPNRADSPASSNEQAAEDNTHDVDAGVRDQAKLDALPTNERSLGLESLQLASTPQTPISGLPWSFPSGAQPLNTQTVRPPTASPEVDAASNLAPWQLDEASRVDMAEPAAAADSQASEIIAGKPPSAWNADSKLLAGYELPGSLTDDEGEAELLVPMPPEDVSLEQMEKPELASLQWLDSAEPDLSDFLADLTRELDSRGADQRVPDESLASERREPTLYEHSVPTDDSHWSEQTTPQQDESLERELRLPEVFQLAEEKAPSHSIDSLSRSQDLQDLQDLQASRHKVDDELVDSHWDDALPTLPIAEPAFVRHARSRAFWMDARVRARLWVAGLALLLLLGGQVAFQNRDLMAVRFPAVRSALVGTCEFLGCVVSPHRDIGAILVEGSSFNRTQGDQYKFLLTLRNRTALQVRAPFIELTLTDVQDQPVVRRVLAAEELNLPKVLQPQEEWSGDIPMVMAPGTARIAGFRMMAFYPN